MARNNKNRVGPVRALGLVVEGPRRPSVRWQWGEDGEPGHEVTEMVPGGHLFRAELVAVAAGSICIDRVAPDLSLSLRQGGDTLYLSSGNIILGAQGAQSYRFPEQQALDWAVDGSLIVVAGYLSRVLGDTIPRPAAYTLEPFAWGPADASRHQGGQPAGGLLAPRQTVST